MEKVRALGLPTEAIPSAKLLARVAGLAAVLFYSSATLAQSSPDSQSSKIRGTLLGLAYGDALGAVVEMWTPKEISRVYGDFDRIPKRIQLAKLLETKGAAQLKYLRRFGLSTDDTQQAMALIALGLGDGSESKTPRWTERQNQLWASTVIQGFQRNAWRGYGKKFLGASQALARGVDYRRSGTPSAGIGAAMRTAPLGALYRGNPAELKNAVMQSSLITHGDLRAAILAYAMAWASAELVEGRPVAEVRKRLPEAVREVEDEWLNGYADWRIDRTDPHAVSRALDSVVSSRSMETRELRKITQAVVRAGAIPASDSHPAITHPNDPFVLLGGLHALALGLCDEPSPSKVLSYIVHLGNDADSVAAMAGAILGARYGAEWIPVGELVERDRIARYADALVSLGRAPETWDEYFSAEAKHLKHELALQSKVSRRCRSVFEF